MSWLPTNYSLNSIKDQFTNLAGEFLNEIRDEKDAEQGSSHSDLNNGRSAEKTADATHFESKIISDLKTQIRSLENEKRELITTLEQLDIDSQQNVEKIIKCKDRIQDDLQKTKDDYDILKKENDKLKEWSGTSEPDTENEELLKRNEELAQEVIELKKHSDRFKMESQKLFEENKRLKHQNEKSCEQMQDQISPADYRKIETILQEYEKRVRSYEIELQELRKTNECSIEDKNSEADSLQNVVESSNKIIESKNAAISQLEERNLELTHKLRSCELEIKHFEEVTTGNSDIDDRKIGNLEQEVHKLNSENNDLKNQFEICQADIKNLADLQTRNQELDNISTLEKNIRELETDRDIVRNKMSLLESENSDSQKLLQNLTQENKNLSHLQKDCADFFEIIYTKCFDSPEDASSNVIEASDVNSKIDLIVNFIADLKSNQLKSRNEISHLSDQNQKFTQEIEKLTRNSSTLKQEIVTKNIEFEEFETEYNELLKSNDLMITEINSLKSNNLLTISETNEDNMLQLENDLENANSKIKELEVILDSEKSRPQSNEPFEMLQKSFDEVNGENQDLQKTVDKYKLDYENLDYKCNEQKAQIDSLTDDLLNSDKQKIYLEEENNLLANKLQELGDAYDVLSKDFIDHKSNSIQDIRNMREKLQSAKMTETSLKLQNDLQSKDILELRKNTVAIALQERLDAETATNGEIKANLGNVIQQLEREVNTLREHKTDAPELREVYLSDPQNELEELKEKYDLQSRELEEHKEKYDILEKQLESLNNDRKELIASLSIKHEESLKYYQEIQNLQIHLHLETEKSRNYASEFEKLKNNDEKQDALSNQIDKLTDQNDFLKEKCDKMTETLMNDQSSSKKQLMDSYDREQGLSKELDRLRKHLLENEDMYTKELVGAEQKVSEMQSKVNEIEQREKNSNNVYTSVSIRANQQVETLQTQLQLVTNQRDEIRNKVSDNEDQINKQAAALMNLQCVLQQFQKDKQKDVHNETDRIRRQIVVEKSVQAELQQEINNLKQQLKESKEGLQAAARLTDQLEDANKNAYNMTNDLIKLRAKLVETEKKYEDTISQPDAKVDKMLIRNLIIGFISTNNNLSKDQHQILKIIGTVLDFTQQENEKLQVNKSLQSGWMNSLLHPAHQNMSQESLSLAFVKFLENESKPINLPSLLDSKSTEKATEKAASQSSGGTKPSLLNDMVLPTFNDYGQRSSSSILKDVLKENH